MFSNQLRDIVRHAEKVGGTPPFGQKELLALLDKCSSGQGLEADEIVELMNSTLKPENQSLILDFSARYQRPHEREILLLPPLYFSSICENRCSYCDFSSNGVRLSTEEFCNEFDALLDLGYRSIELVSSQDSALYLHQEPFGQEDPAFHIDGVLRYFNLAQKRLAENGGGMLTCNIPPVDRESFGHLKVSGLDCYLAWLETFDPFQYKRLHYDKGPKANQAYRLDSFERAVDAGIEHLAGAFLKGLYDWRKEEVGLYLLDRYLKSKNGAGFSIIGTPRLKGAFTESSLVNPFLVSDQDYELNVALDRILFDGILWLQTRESFGTNCSLIERYGGGVILTLTSSTAPGGYHKPASATPQFPVHKQNLDQSVQKLEALGMTVLFDWSSKTLSHFQRRG